MDLVDGLSISYLFGIMLSFLFACWLFFYYFFPAAGACLGCFSWYQHWYMY